MTQFPSPIAKLTRVHGNPDIFMPSYDLSGKTYTIGRSLDSDILWSTGTISRGHAALEYRNGQWFLRRLGSNSILVNDYVLVKGEIVPVQDSHLIDFLPDKSVSYRFTTVGTPHPSIIKSRSVSKRLKVGGPLKENVAPLFTEKEIEDCDDADILRAQLAECLARTKKTEAEIKSVEEDKVQYRKDYQKKAEERQQAVLKATFEKKVVADMASDLKCAICQQIFIKATVINCGHTFCKFCIGERFKQDWKCPRCGQVFRDREPHFEMESFVNEMFATFSEETNAARRTAIKRREEEMKNAAPLSKQNA